MFTGVLALLIAFPGEFSIEVADETPPAVARFNGVALSMDRGGLPDLGMGESIRFVDMPLAPGQAVDLELVRFDAFTPEARVVISRTGPDGERIQEDADRPDVVLLRGTIVDDPTSQVFLAFGQHTTNGLIRHRGRTHVMARHMTDGWTAVYDLDAVDPAMMNWVDVGCEAIPVPGMPAANPAGRGISEDCPPRLRLAIETDWQFTGNLFGGNTDASGEYAATLVGAMASIYIEDLDVGAQISYLSLWADSTDPWSGGSSSDQLVEFQSYWNANMDTVDRHLAHMFSGQGLGGGVAYVGAVCSDYGYAVSGNLGGSFPLPIEDNNGNNWDLMVVSHETGHNCGTGHTHDYSPPIDGCGNGDCSDAWGGTIMSYCHLCDGGLSNMVMSFHPTIQITIENYLANVGCELGGDGSPPVAGIDQVAAFAGDVIDIDVLANDYTNDCSVPAIVSHDPLSYYGGTIEMIGADPSEAILRYTPPGGDMAGDLFQYIMVDGSGQEDLAGVVVQFIYPRPADTPSWVEAGARARYYALDNPSVLPDFDLLDPIGEEIVGLVDYPSTGGNFAGSGLSNDVGAVFDGFIEIPVTGTYTLYVNSDDGSRLYVGDELLVDNDGLHGMVEIGGSILLAAGRHEVRVEFFERGGGAGCIVSIAGNGLEKQVVSADRWSHEVQVPEDVNGDGAITMDDILLILNVWGPCDSPCQGDVDGNQVVDINDLLAVVGVWPV
ncbi:MAG: M12 family metallo-peptidase [Phycisphaerales bacterium]|nr:M12 family metallo-peptidase [Phycisphaerales bacterium]